MSDGRFDTSGLTPPESWDELVSLREFLISYGGAVREKEDQEYYDLFSKIIPRELTLRLIQEQLQDKEAVLVKNPFPYSYVLQKLPWVKHYLLWCRNQHITKEQVDEVVRAKFPNADYFYFETAIGNKSVPEIFHLHVFVHSK